MSSSLLHHWVVAGIVSASSRFIPIPFVDDVVRDQCRRYVVSQTLAAHETELSTQNLKPFYDGGGGCLGGCMGMVVRAPLKLILFPIRKLVAIVTSVRGVPLEVTRTVLLGRTLDRYLREQKVVDSPEYLAKMRTAFEQSFKRMDFRIVRAAIGGALSGIGDWKSGATESAKAVAGPKDAEQDGLDTTEDVEAGANKVEEVLERPETRSLFAEFDQRFDESLQRLIKKS